MGRSGPTPPLPISPSLFFGRIEASGDGYVLIVGNTVYPGTETPKGWSFSWTTSSVHDDDHLHATGYDFLVHTDDEITTTIAGSFKKGAFSGTWAQSTLTLDTWTELDTWSEEAATTVGTSGQTPVSSYLVKVDEYGAEVPVTNVYDGFDCTEATCNLTVQSSCQASYAVTGELTDFSSDDNRWVEDATQPAGT